MSFTSRRALAALATVAALTLAACGSSDSGATDAAASGTAGSAPAATSASAPESGPTSPAESAASASSAPASDSSSPAAASSSPADLSGSTLVVYSGRDEELVAPLIETFEEQSGVDVDVRYAGTTELAAQLLEEGDDTPAEVFLSQDAGALGALSEAGMFTTLPDPVTGAVDPKFTSPDGTWVGLTGRARVVVYDSEELTADEVPGDVAAFVEPEWKGRVAVVPSNASFQSFVTAMRVTEGEEKTAAWLAGIAANDPQIFSRNGEVLEAVNAGAVDVGLINHYYWARSEQDPTTLRAQLKFGDAGTVSALVNVTGAGILTGAADSAAAAAFIEFLISDTAQEYFRTETYEYPLAGDLTGPDGVPALGDLGQPDINLSELSSLDQTVTMITEAGLL